MCNFATSFKARAEAKFHLGYAEPRRRLKLSLKTEK